ncbi:S1 family peptidase [Acidobacteria bacterium AH-259-L09]|nr:S1 family peptidase [Acidobacteria bacterium AH-259-L09]
MRHKKRLLVVVSLLLFFLGTVLFAQEPVVSRAELARAIAVQERYTGALMADPEVVGTGVGVGANGRPVIKVFVKRGRIAGLRGTLDGVPVVTQVTGEIVALKGKPGGGGGKDKGDPVDPTAKFDRAVPIGVSTGHPNITAGTIGCRVTDGTDVFALSNNHVYADENWASIGDVVLQPGSFDGGAYPEDEIGTLFDFEPIVFSTLASNTIDAAIALSSTANLGNATPSDGYGTPKSMTGDAKVNLRVKKYGRTTGETKGIIAAINAIVNVGYDSGVARFVGQIIIQPGSFSAGGDSGSLIVSNGKGNNKNKPIGLLFAGSPFITVANPIDLVLTRFGVTVDGQ